MSAAAFLPYGRQSIDQSDIDAVAEALRSDYLTTGPKVAQFEQDFCALVGAKHGVALSNATTALHLAMIVAGVGPDDAVIVPTVTFLATANAARYCGATVVFADVDPDTGLMTTQTAKDALARAAAAGLKVKVMAPVHLAGQCVNMAELAALCAPLGITLVEDACHGVGTIDNSGPVGAPVGACAHSTMATFSFHPVKTLACGEGGMITLNDPVMARRLSLLRSHGMEREPAHMTPDGPGFDEDGSHRIWAYEMGELAYNYRLTDFQSALGSSQLKRFDHFAQRRKTLSALYQRALSQLGPHIKASPLVAWSDPVLHLQVALIDFAGLGKKRQDVMKALHGLGIGTQVHYTPVHHQPYYKALYPNLDLPGAEAFYDRCLSLPLYPDMKDEDVARVAEALKQVLV